MRWNGMFDGWYICGVRACWPPRVYVLKSYFTLTCIYSLGTCAPLPRYSRMIKQNKLKAKINAIHDTVHMNVTYDLQAYLAVIVGGFAGT